MVWFVVGPGGFRKVPEVPKTQTEVPGGCRLQVAGCKGLRVGVHSVGSGSSKAAGSRI